MRVQVELADDEVQLMKDLMENLGIETYKDLFNNGLNVLSWAAEERQRGRQIATVDENANVYHILKVPALERAARRAIQSPQQAVGSSSNPNGLLKRTRNR